MLTLTDMIAHGVPDAPPPAIPTPLRCAGCPSLVARHSPTGLIGPHGTSARCLEAEGGTRLIGWEWHPADAAPHWCPKRGDA